MNNSPEAFIHRFDHGGELDVVLPLLDLDGALRQHSKLVVGRSRYQLVQLLLCEWIAIVRVTLENELLRALRVLFLVDFSPVLRDEIGSTVDGIVNGKVRQVKKEGLVPVVLDKSQRFVGQSIGQVVTRLVGESIELEGCVIAGARPTLVPVSRNLNVKALIQRPELGFAQMPLAKMSGRITVRLQRFGQSDFVERQLLKVRRVLQQLKREVTASRNPV